jgi:hypothetical protein
MDCGKAPGNSTNLRTLIDKWRVTGLRSEASTRQASDR